MTFMPMAALALKDATPCGASPIDGFLQQLATEHAAYQARRNRQGHQLFGTRFQQILKHFKDTGQYADVHEICAESWPWLKDSGLNAVAEDMVKSWRQSKGHWSVAKRTWSHIGLDMAKASKGIWYACIIAVDLKPMPKTALGKVTSIIQQASQPVSLPHLHYWEVASRTGVGRTPGICLPHRLSR